VGGSNPPYARSVLLCSTSSRVLCRIKKGRMGRLRACGWGDRHSGTPSAMSSNTAHDGWQSMSVRVRFSSLCAPRVLVSSPLCRFAAPLLSSPLLSSCAVPLQPTPEGQQRHGTDSHKHAQAAEDKRRGRRNGRGRDSEHEGTGSFVACPPPWRVGSLLSCWCGQTGPISNALKQAGSGCFSHRTPSVAIAA